MDDRNRRSWRVATDGLGPRTGIRPRLNRRGLGGFLFVGGNPVSWTVDPVIGCLPFLSLTGGRDQASQDTRNALNQDDEGTAFSIPGLLGGGGGGLTTGNPGASQGTPSSTPAGTPTSSGSGGSGAAPASGPFAYIGAVKR